MKKIIAASLSAILLAFLTSCGSTKIVLNDHQPVALVSVIGNSSVPWVQNDPNDENEATSDGLLTNAVNRLIDGNNPELVTAVDRLEYAVDSFNKIIPEVANAQVLDRNEVVNSEAYLDLRSSLFNALSSTKYPEGYKDLTTFGGKNARTFMGQIGAKSCVILKFTFEKKISTGNKWNGNLYGVVTMKARVLDERGKEIINKEYVSNSPVIIRSRSHKYDKDALVATFNDEIDNVIRQFAVEFMSETAGTNDAAPVEVKEEVKGTPLPKPVSKSVTAETATVESSTDASADVSEETAPEVQATN